MMDDDALLTAIGTGDHLALRTLFERHAPWVAGRLRRALPANAVEDVVQETFLAVWRGASGYHRDGEAGAWVWGIARRQAALWARRNGRAEQMLNLDELVNLSIGDDPAKIATDRGDLELALATLGTADDQRLTLARLVFVEDQPLGEVARRLGVPVGTVKSRVFAVRRQLQAALRGEGTNV
jgi:RNA polymerase sigma-70 factor (ECF subfamily)